MFKKLLFLFIIFILIISCRRATTRPTLDSIGSPPEDPNSPVIDVDPEPTPEPTPDPEFIIIATDSEEEIESKIQKYYEKHTKYAAFVEGSEEDIKQNNTLEKINTVITRNAYSEGISLDLSETTIIEIPDNSFYGNKYLSYVTLPETLTSIGNNVFGNAEKLIEINFPSALTKIGEGAFRSCINLREVDLQYTKITTLSPQIFAYCDNLSKVVFPEGLLTIENSAFSYCVSLEEITLPEYFRTIGTFVFAECTKLKKVNLNKNIKSIYHYAFYRCISLSSISLPSSLMELGIMGPEIFPDCTSLSDVEYLGTNPEAISCSGNVFDNSMPENLYLPNVEEPADPNMKEKWEKFLGYDWTDKIKYKQSIPIN
ncbi:leucine-rich repeat domain-containing protein [Brachyspira sp. SAP_772]|uniref:leucine-rich repeat domain-containing protein n=1 Tax=Brachyspira sp. SAP_772 TaxID=2608385 RepID=UPI0012F49EC0|nr:leucine-rich repeat domain-containing protein [Brachyspira sp. SAP_772]